MYINPIRYRDFLKYGKTIRSVDNLTFLSDFTYRYVSYESISTDVIYEYEQPIFLEPATGIGVLVIFDEIDSHDPNKYTQFLFTRPIVLNPGIKFCLYPYESEFSFHQFTCGSCKKYHQNIYPYIKSNFIKFSIDRIYSFLYREDHKNFIFKGEKHNFWELMYVDKGEISCTLDGKEYNLKQGDIIFYRPNEFHSVRANSVVTYLNISFSMHVYNTSLLSKAVYQIDNHIHRLFSSMIKEVESLDDYSVDIVTSYLKLIILRLEHMGNAVDKNKISSSYEATNTSNIVERCLGIISDSIYSESLSVSYIAQQLSVSSSYLYRQFKNAMNISIQDHIAAVKLDEAKNLIATGKYTISQVSQKLNYCSQTYFSTKFKEKYGVTPREYSKSIYFK